MACAVIYYHVSQVTLPALNCGLATLPVTSAQPLTRPAAAMVHLCVLMSRLTDPVKLTGVGG